MPHWQILLGYTSNVWRHRPVTTVSMNSIRSRDAAPMGLFDAPEKYKSCADVNDDISATIAAAWKQPLRLHIIEPDCVRTTARSTFPPGSYMPLS
jgi:hypothetical protein